MPSKSIAFLNGRYVPFSQAALPLDDAGFVYGAVVVDRFRTFRGQTFRLDDHLNRFRRSCELSWVPQPRPDDELRTIVTELLDRNRRLAPQDTELAIIVFATPGNGDAPTLGAYAMPFSPERYRVLFSEGARLASSARAMAPELIDPRIKHRSRLAWWIAERESAAIPLFVSAPPKRWVRETPTANFLAVIDGTLMSPPRGCVLNGVALSVVAELCASAGIPFLERELPLDEVATKSSECLLCNSSFGVAGVAALDDTSVPWPGPVWQRLLAAWSDLVGVDMAAQILAKR